MKKIVITFNSQPTAGNGIDYTIQIDGLELVYYNGLDSVSFDFANTALDPNKVFIGSTLSDTINNTLFLLKSKYVADNIVYERVGDSIEISILVNGFVNIYYSNVNASLSVEIQSLSSLDTYKQIYFLQYKNIVNDEYKCEILKKNYIGTFTEIHGNVTIEKASVTGHLDSLRGGGISLKLEANKDLTLESLYSEGENDFLVKLYKNGKILFLGFLNPDGVFQDYVRDEWVITLDCVDGLGSLSNLSFVQNNGLYFTGKMKAMDIIFYCLKRTGLEMPINTSVNILYEGLVSGDDVLSKIYLNSDRFVKKDESTIMSCEEVLKSILEIFKACITQIDGEWYIYKPNEIFLNAYVDFRQFNSLNVFLGTRKVNLNKTLGSQIDNFYPHHCTGNQKIEIKGSVGGFRINYKYGKVVGLFPNPTLIKTGNTLSYSGWTVQDPSLMINDPQKNSGFYFKNSSTISGATISVISNPIPVTIDDDLTLKISFDVQADLFSSFIKMQIKAGTKYLSYAPKNDQTPIEDTANAVWSSDSSKTFIFYLHNKKGTFNIQLPKIVEDGNMTIAIIKFQGSGTTLITELDILPSQSDDNLQGEFHTVEMTNRVSSIVKENQTVFNGDNASIVYSGAIFKENLEPTTQWNRINTVEKFPILRIAAEEELRISQRPLKLFRGDVYGYIPYLSLININNVGNFMPIEWSYDTMTNITTLVNLELFASELVGIIYKKTIDYGETTKPTIK